MTLCAPIKLGQGLEDAIGVSITHPTWQRSRPDDPHDKHTGWIFRKPDDPPLSSPTGCVDRLALVMVTGALAAAPSDAAVWIAVNQTVCKSRHGSFGCEGCIPDTINGAKFIRDLYEMADDKLGAVLRPSETVAWSCVNRLLVHEIVGDDVPPPACPSLWLAGKSLSRSRFSMRMRPVPN